MGPAKDLRNNNLVSSNPELVKEWHPTKNGDLTPDQVSPGSHKKVWWLGKCGHEWESTVGARVRYKTGCPFCSNTKVLAGFNDLESQSPDLAKEWHPTKNGDLTPDQVVFGSHKKVWWLGKCGHEWCSTIFTRYNGSRCPICSNNRLLKGYNDLSTTNEELAREWHPTKNGDLKPTDVTKSSDLKVWWLGKCGHEWRATVDSRNKGAGCPVCNRQNLTSFPEKAIAYYLSEYLYVEENYRHPDLGGLELDIFIPSINVGIEYDGAHWHNKKRDLVKNEKCRGAHIRLIRIRESSCPSIEGCEIISVDTTDESLSSAIVDLMKLLKIDVSDNVVDVRRDSGIILSKQRTQLLEKSLGSLFPEVASTWHPTKNGYLTPFQISAYSNKKIWWKCSKGHEWNLDVSNRVKNGDCPYCKGYRVIPDENSLEALYPEIAKDWDYERNGSLKPNEVKSQSQKKIWWKCSKGHVECCNIQQRVIKGGCPYCNKLRASDDYNFAHSYPVIAKSWNYERNGTDHPSNYMPSSNKVVWWICEKGHEWQASISTVSKGHYCPYCSGRNPIPGETDLQTQCPDVSKYWHPTKNGDLKPSDVSKKSEKIVWWRCPNGHEWQAKIKDRSRTPGCPICNGKVVQKGFNDLETTNPDLAKEWHPTKNGDLKPSAVTKGSGKKVWWLGKCGHEWQSTISDRSSGNRCPYCSSRALLKGFNDLETTNPDLAKEWHPTKNGDLKPSDVFRCSNKNVWWLGKCGHEWQAKVSHRVNGKGCPQCHNELRGKLLKESRYNNK